MEKEILYLKIFAALITLGFAVLSLVVFRMAKARSFEEINVERINIVEKDGTLKMVISNQARQHPGIMDGITYEERRGKRPAGLMFFNDKGDELGGLVFAGNTGEGQGGSFTFDKFRGDQTIQFIHQEDKDEKYFAGLKMNDQNLPLNDLVNKQKEISKLPTQEAKDAAFQALRDQGLLMTERLKIGKDFDKASVIKLKDAKGRERIAMKVEANGDAKLEFLDEQGKVIYRLPEDGNGRR